MGGERQVCKKSRSSVSKLSKPEGENGIKCLIPLPPLFHKAPKISWQCFVEFQYAKNLQKEDINIDEAIIQLYPFIFFLILVVMRIKSNSIAGNKEM